MTGLLTEVADLLAPAPRPSPVRWVQDTLHEEPWTLQRQIISAVETDRRVAVKACFDVGKSWLASRLACWWVSSTKAPAFVLSTAPSFPQVRAILWREIGLAHRAGNLPGRVNQTEWWLAPDREHRTAPAAAAGETLVAFGRKPPASDPGVAFQGIHSGEGGVLVIFDEAAGIPAALWDAAEGAMADEASRFIVIGNPDDPVSPFANCWLPQSEWTTFTISAFDSPNFTGERVAPAVGRSLVSKLWVEERRRAWKEEHPLWQSRVLGEFPEGATDTVIPLGLARQAQYRDLDRTTDRPTLGVDVARFGTDDSAIVACYGPVVTIVEVLSGADTVKVSGRVKHHADDLGAPKANVDGVGIGAGVVDALRAMPGHPSTVNDMQAGASARDKERFVDARSEWWWAVRERAEAGDLDLPSEGPLAERLLAELTAPKYTYDARGRIKVESKDQLKGRGVASPDLADAVIMGLCQQTAWAPPEFMPGGDTRSAPTP